MNFIKAGRYPITLQGIINENPQTSFPVGFDPTELGYEPVLPVERPTYTETQYLFELAPVQRDGKWFEQWEVRDMATETIAVNQARATAQHNARILAQIEEIERKQARAVREATLGKGKQYLQQIEDQIIALRAQLL